MFNNHGIPAVYRFEEGSMPKLETLVLKFYVGQQSIVGIEHLTNLKEVHFTGENNGNRKIMEDELEKLKQENERRKRNGSNQLTVKVRYDRMSDRSFCLLQPVQGGVVEFVKCLVLDGCFLQNWSIREVVV